MHNQRGKKKLIYVIAIFLFLISFSWAQSLNVLKVSVKDFPDFSRLVIESSSPLAYHIEKSSSFLMVRIRSNKPFRIQRRAFKSRIIESLGWAEGSDYYLLNIKIKNSSFSYDYSVLNSPPRLVFDISLQGKKGSQRGTVSKEKELLVGKKTKKEFLRHSSKRVKTIVIDPGHGGLETGAKGKFGTLEKNITLDIGLKLKAIIQRNLAFRVVLTRDKDIDVSLDNRAAIANNNRADLFISIHANSSYRKEANGSETFFLSLNATDEEARKLAYLENNSANFEEGIDQDNEQEIKMILWDMAQASYLKQSSQLAECIQKELNLLLGTMNRGIKQAPFKVLTGVACPAVLVEVAFISNPVEERKLQTEGFQSNVAQAVYRGLVNYLQQNSQE